MNESNTIFILLKIKLLYSKEMGKLPYPKFGGEQCSDAVMVAKCIPLIVKFKLQFGGGSRRYPIVEFVLFF